MTPAPDITIPPEAIEAAAIDLYRAMYPSSPYHPWDKIPEWMRHLKREHARAACLAMLRAWPGMIETDIKWKHPAGPITSPSIILTLQKENSNGES